MIQQRENDIYLDAHLLTTTLTFEERGLLAFRILKLLSETFAIGASWELWGPTDADHEENFPERGIDILVADDPESLLTAMARYNDSDNRSGWNFYAGQSELSITAPISPLSATRTASEHVYDCQVAVIVDSQMEPSPDAIRRCLVQISKLVNAYQINAALRRDSKYGTPPFERMYFYDEPSDDYLLDVGWLNAYPHDTPLDRTLLPPHAQVWDADGYVYIQLCESPNALTHSDIDALFQAQEAGIAERRQR